VIQPHNEEHKGVSELIEGGMIDGAVISGLVEKKCPLASMLNEHPQFPWVSFDEPAEYSVLSATDEGVEQAMQYLAALGHQKIAVTFGDVQCQQHAHVKKGYESAVRQFGLKTQKQWVAQFPGSFTVALREKEMKWAYEILSKKNRPTALFCGGIGTAAIVMHVAAKLGLDVPNDLSVIGVGFGVDASSQAIIPTILERDYKSMMTAAISMLRARLQGRSVEQMVQRFAPNLIHGQSVARVPA
jgi:DNA-binding LacI/PurR family transcriptional regulator